MIRHAVLVAVLIAPILAATGCSYARDLMTICDAPNAVDVSGVAPEYQQMELARYLDRRIRSPAGRNLFEGLAMMDLEERARTLEAEALNAGLEGCAFADLMRELAETPAEPEPAYEVVTPPDDAGSESGAESADTPDSEAPAPDGDGDGDGDAP